MTQELSDINRVYIPHLKGQFSQGRVVLFTGAGFSRAATNLDGQPMATVADLRARYWSICYPSEPLDSTATLQDLFDEMRANHRSALVTETTRALTVNPASIPEWYRTVFSMPWFKAYTLNIDDLAVGAERRFTLPRGIRQVSALDPDSRASATQPSKTLEVVHLNGTLGGLPDKVTFSTTQYAQRIADQDPFYMRAVADLLTRSVVFIGTTLDESPLWQHIEQRGGRGERGLGELRPRSYLVTPSLSLPRAKLLSRYNVVWLKMDAQQFATEVLAQMRESATAGLEQLKALDASGAPAGKPVDVSSLHPNPEEKTEFLIGLEPSWCDIVSGRAVHRDFDAALWAAVTTETQKTSSRRPIVVTGVAGSGKSTSVMRVALRLASEGKRVAWLDRTTEVSSGAIAELALHGSGPDAIVIDDADRYGTYLSSLLRECFDAPRHPLLVLEMRSHQVDRCLNRAQLSHVDPVEMGMPALSDHDIDALIAALDRENRLGRLKGLQAAERRKVFRSSADRDLLVAMYEATTGQRFQERIADELGELRHPANLIYATAAVATSRRFDLTRDELLLAVGDSSNETLNEIDRLLKRGLLTRAADSSDRLRCRHRRVGELLMEGIHQAGFMPRVVSGLLTAGAAKADPTMPRSSRAFRIVRTFISHEFVHEMLSIQQGRDLYADIESLLHWDYHYWLHRGSFEVEWGELGHAENFLAQAQSLMPTDAFVRNELAYLLFKKALKNPRSHDAKTWANDAHKILVDLIYDQTPRPHPYHVLGVQGLSWAQRGLETDEERATYIQDLQRLVGRGVKMFPTNRQIADISATLKDAYLRLAVR